MVKNPFVKLSLEMYLLTFYILQMIVFLTFDQSQRFIAKEILSGAFDYVLLRPVNLFYFKYFRIPSLMAIVMTLIYIVTITITTIIYRIPTELVLTLVAFALLASFIILNIKSGMRGLVFFRRDILNSTRVEESLNIFVMNKPPEIFPAPVKILFTFFIPYLVVHNHAFEVLRGNNSSFVWTMLGVWVCVSVMFNKVVWYFGLKKYESG